MEESSIKRNEVSIHSVVNLENILLRKDANYRRPQSRFHFCEMSRTGTSRQMGNMFVVACLSEARAMGE